MKSNNKRQGVAANASGMPMTRTTLANPYASYVRASKQPVNGTQRPISSNYKPGCLIALHDSKQDALDRQTRSKESSFAGHSTAKEGAASTAKDLSIADAQFIERYSSANQVMQNHDYQSTQLTKSQPSPRIAQGQVRNVVSLKNDSILQNSNSQGQSSSNSNRMEEKKQSYMKNCMIAGHFSYDGTPAEQVRKNEQSHAGKQAPAGNEHSIIKILTQTYKQKQLQQKTLQGPKTPGNQGSVRSKIFMNTQLKPKVIADNVSQTSYGKPRSALPSPLIAGINAADEKQQNSVQDANLLHIAQKLNASFEFPPSSVPYAAPKTQGTSGAKSSKFQNIRNLDSKNHFIQQRNKNTKNNFVSAKYVMPRSNDTTLHSGQADFTARSMQSLQKSMVQQANTRLQTFAQRDNPNVSQVAGSSEYEHMRNAPINLMHLASEQASSSKQQINKSRSKDSINSGTFGGIGSDGPPPAGQYKTTQANHHQPKRNASEERAGALPKPKNPVRQTRNASRHRSTYNSEMSEANWQRSQKSKKVQQQQLNHEAEKQRPILAGDKSMKMMYNSAQSQNGKSPSSGAVESTATANTQHKKQKMKKQQSQNLNLTIRVKNQRNKQEPQRSCGLGSTTNKKYYQPLIQKKGTTAGANLSVMTPSCVLDRVNEMQYNQLHPSQARMQTKIAIQMSQILNNNNSPKGRLAVGQAMKKVLSPPLKKQITGANAGQGGAGSVLNAASCQSAVDRLAIEQIIEKRFRSRQSMQETKKTSHQDTIDGIGYVESTGKTIDQQRLLLNQSSNSNKVAQSEKVGIEESLVKHVRLLRGNSKGNNEREAQLGSAQAALRKSSKQDAFTKLQEQTELHKQRMLETRKGSASQLMASCKKMTLQSNSSLQRNNNIERPRNSKSRSQSKISRSHISNSSLGRKSSIPRPHNNLPGAGIIPKSQSYLIQIFYREFWPEVQKVLRFRSKNEIVKMLSNYDMKDVSGKEMEDAFLFNDTDFILKNQRHWSESKDILQISHKSLEYKINCEQIESVLRSLGFLRGQDDKKKASLERQSSPLEIDKSLEERIEFMKFWRLLAKVEKRKRAHSPIAVDGSPQLRIFEKHLKRISTNVKQTGQGKTMHKNMRGFSPDQRLEKFDLILGKENELMTETHISQTIMQPETIKIMEDDTNERGIEYSNQASLKRMKAQESQADEGSNDEQGFDEAYLKNELQGSALVISHKSSNIVTAQKIQDVQNVKVDFRNQTEEVLDRKQPDSTVKESSLLGQLLAPCLTTLGDNRDDEEDDGIELGELEQTVSVRSFLSTLLELMNIKKSLLRLSLRFPILFMNRKEYEETKKKTSEYNMSMQTVRSQREELANQHLERRQLFKQEKEQTIQIKELGYFGTHRHSVNENLKQKERNDKMIKQGQTNSNYQQYNLFMNSLRNKEIPDVVNVPRIDLARKSRGSSRSKDPLSQGSQQAKRQSATRQLQNIRMKAKQRKSMEQVAAKYKGAYLTPTNAYEGRINFQGASQNAADLGTITEPDSSLALHAQQTSESEPICLELPAYIRGTQQIQPKGRRNDANKGKSAELVVEKKKKGASASVETDEGSNMLAKANNKFLDRQSQRDAELSNKRSYVTKYSKQRGAKKQEKSGTAHEKKKSVSKKGSINVKKAQGGSRTHKNSIKINEILDALPKLNEPNILRPQESPRHWSHGQSVQFSTVRSNNEKPARATKQQSQDMRTDNRQSETFEQGSGAPTAKKHKKSMVKLRTSPIIVIDLDELRAKQKMKKNPSAFLRTQRTLQENEAMQKSSQSKRMQSQGRNGEQLGDKTYLEIALQKKKVNDSQTGLSEAFSHRSQRSTTRVKNRSLRTHSSFNFEQTSLNNESLRQKEDNSISNTMQIHEPIKYHEGSQEEDKDSDRVIDTERKFAEILKKKKEKDAKTRMTTLSEEAEFNIQETTIKKQTCMQGADSLRNLFGSFQNMSDLELDQQIQQIQNEYKDLNQKVAQLMPNTSQRELFVSPDRHVEGSNQPLVAVRIASPTEREQALAKAYQTQPRVTRNELELQRVSQPTTLGPVSSKDINDQSISSIKLNQEMQRNDQRQARISQKDQQEQLTVSEEVIEEAPQEQLVHDVGENDQVNEQEDEKAQEEDENASDSLQDEENIYFFEPSNHFLQMQLRQHLKASVNKSQQFVKKAPLLNDEVIKETFREDSLASSEEGILASHSPGKGVNRTNYGTSLQLTETALVDCLENSRQNIMKMSHLKGLNVSASQNSAEHVKRSVSSDGDISKLKADVLKFMQKQESREQINLRKSSGLVNQTISQASPSSKAERRTEQPQKEKAFKDLPVLFSEVADSPQKGGVAGSSRNSRVGMESSLQLNKQTSTLTEKLLAERHRSAGRNGSRNNTINMVVGIKDNLDDILSSQGRQTPTQAAESMNCFDNNVKQKTIFANQESTGKPSYTLQPMMFQTFAPSRDSKNQPDTPGHETPELNAGGGNTVFNTVEVNQFDDQTKDQPAFPELSRCKSSKRKQPKQNSLLIGESPRHLTDPFGQAHIRTQSSAEDLQVQYLQPQQANLTERNDDGAEGETSAPVAEKQSQREHTEAEEALCQSDTQQENESKIVYFSAKLEQESMAVSLVKDDDDLLVRDLQEIKIQVEEEKGDEESVVNRQAFKEAHEGCKRLQAIDQLASALQEAQDQIQKQKLDLPHCESIEQTQRSDIFEKSVQNQPYVEESSADIRPQSVTTDNGRLNESYLSQQLLQGKCGLKSPEMYRYDELGHLVSNMTPRNVEMLAAPTTSTVRTGKNLTQRGPKTQTSCSAINVDEEQLRHIIATEHRLISEHSQVFERMDYHQQYLIHKNSLQYQRNAQTKQMPLITQTDSLKSLDAKPNIETTADKLNIQFDDNSTIFLHAPSQMSSKLSSPIKKQRLTFSNQSSENSPTSKNAQRFQGNLQSIPETPAPRILKFEIHIDQRFGTQVLEIFGKQNIRMAVERFALKFGIRDQHKINKLMKLVKRELKKQHTDEEQSFVQ